MSLRTVIAVASLALVAGAYVLSPGTFEEPLQVLRSGNAETIAGYIRSFGGWAIVASIVLSIIMTFCLIIPFVFLSAANGLVFGLGWGTVISWAGEVMGAIFAFSIYRYYLRPAFLHRFAHKKNWHYVEKISGEYGFVTVLTGRIFPVIPSGVLTAAASLSTISFFDFSLATLIGKVPSVFIKVLVGHDLLFLSEYKARFIGGVVLLTILYVGAWWIRRRTDDN